MRTVLPSAGANGSTARASVLYSRNFGTSVCDLPVMPGSARSACACFREGEGIDLNLADGYENATSGRRYTQQQRTLARGAPEPLPLVDACDENPSHDHHDNGKGRHCDDQTH